MRGRDPLILVVAGVASLCTVLAAGPQTQKPAVQVPQPGVPQIMTIEGAFVRAAYNNEGYAILGYRVANQSVGEEWMLIDIQKQVEDAFKKR
jgi:hypothetical protein